MLGAGKSIEEAEAAATLFVKELWKAEKEGPEAVAAIQAEILALIESIKEVAEEQDATTETIVEDSEKVVAAVIPLRLRPSPRSILRWQALLSPRQRR